MMESVHPPSAAVRSVLGQLPAGTAIADQHGYLCYANQALCTLIAVSQEMLQGMAWLERLFPDDRDKLRLTLAAVARDQGSKRLEVRLLVMGHAEISTAVDLSPFSDEDGAPSGILVVFSPIREAAIGEGLKLVDHIPVAAMMTDETRQIEYVNRRLSELTGYAGVKILGNSPTLLQPGETAGENYFSAQHAQMPGHPTQEQECRCAELKCLIHPDDLERVMATLPDTTEGGGDALWDWDISANCVFRSPRWFDMLNMKDDGSVSTIEQLTSHMHAEDQASIAAQLDDLKKRRTDSFRGDYKIPLRKGSNLWASMRGKAMTLDSHQRALRVIGTIRDTSRRKRAEEAACRQQQQLAHSARLIRLDEMASAIAHEINQPLTAIANFSGACMRTLGDNAVVAKHLEKIEQHALQAQEIIWRMRDFARKRAQPRNPICLSELVTQVFNEVRHEAILYDVNLSIQVPAEDLPKVRVDRVQIEQVLLNLVSNGIDAMRKVSHERVIEITVLPITEGKEILLSVRDTGAGVPEDIARNIFKPFFTTKESGLGLGLAVSCSIIEDHGGRLWLSSTRSAHGTTFFFTLPTVQNEQTT